MNYFMEENFTKNYNINHFLKNVKDKPRRTSTMNTTPNANQAKARIWPAAPEY